MNWYGVHEKTVVDSDAARHAEEIRISGYSVVPRLVDAPMLQTIRTRLDSAYAAQAAEVGGEERLRAINDANVARCLLAQDLFFLQLATHPRVLAIAAELLGDYFILQQQNGVINPPSGPNHQSAWHRDLPYQHFVTSRPLALSALWCIDEFNEVTGGTWVVPASHRTERSPSEDFVQSHAKGIVGQPGDALVFDSMLYHRAGENNSGKLRRGINHVYSLPFLKQQIDLPWALGGKLSDDPFLRRLLGYESEPGTTALEWRQRRLAKLAG
jgi:ectoine hydroxylase-related dioxygenase (phytanoyl-CoA dioxygenase family)